MNFIIIISDTLRRDHLGCYGNERISTPHIDRFAAESLLFLNAYSASFPTVPHRRDVLTGRYTASYTAWAPLGGDELVLAEMLREADYMSMMVLDTPHIVANGFRYDRGFDGWEWIRGQESDRVCTTPEFPDLPCDPAKLRSPGWAPIRHRRNVAARRYESDTFVAQTMTTACRWLEDNYRRERFFLYVDTFDPHEPWDAPQWYVDMYDPGYEGDVVDYPRYAPCDYLTDAELTHMRALYAGEVSLVDRWVGRLLQKIEDLGLLDDTMVIVTTDHGFLHGEHGLTGKSLIDETGLSNIPLWEEICHIPMIVRFPGAGSGRVSACVQPMDFAPTMVELAGLPIPEPVNGRSFARVLRGEADEHREFTVSSPYLGGGLACATITCGKWSAMCWSSPEPTDVPDLAVDGIPKQPVVDIEHCDMLFDIEADPGQQDNVAEAHPDVLAELRARAVAFWREIGTEEAILARWQGD